MQLTWLDSNSWLIELGEKRILLDPWLVGDLVFGDWRWLFEGKRDRDRLIPDNIDFILLSQGLEDHAHRPTLQKLDRALPVIASKNAANVVRSLGYHQVTALDNGESYVFENAIEIHATPGSRVGITAIENGYVLKDLPTGETLYYEPHGFHSETVRQFAPVDVVISPIVNLSLPFLPPIIQGKDSAIKISNWLKPQYFIDTAAGGDIKYSGWLVNLLRLEGSVEEFQAVLERDRLKTKAIAPTPGDPFQLNIAPSAGMKM